MTSKREGRKQAVTVPVGADPDVRVFSPSKYRIMLVLKREGPMDLEALSKKLSVSQMAVYKHIRELESRGLITHEAKIRGVGRPRLVFRPSENSVGVYPSAYSELASAALETLDKRLGRDAVKGVLKEIQSERFSDYASRIGDGGLEEKVRSLASVREAYGYMGEVSRPSKGEVELIEHHCPISAVAAKYPEMCEVEAQILGELLEARVQPVSLDPKGMTPCRFRITAR